MNDKFKFSDEKLILRYIRLMKIIGDALRHHIRLVNVFLWVIPCGDPATGRPVVVGLQGIPQLMFCQACTNWTDINFERVEHGEADHLGQGHTQKMLHHETCKKN